MSEQMIYHTTDDNHVIAIHYWPCKAQASKGTVIWLHGMSEHGARYQNLASILNAAGWHLYCPDHRGHGASISDTCPAGHIGDQHGWQHLMNDVASVIHLAKEKHPQLPVVLGGHSMGSFVALGAAEQLGDTLAGLVLCASDYHPGAYYRLMGLPVRFERMRQGKRNPSPVIRKLTFGTWATRIPEATTEFDWLSGNPEEVKRYIDDPLCGFDCSTETWMQLVTAMRRIQSIAGLSELPETLPVLLLGGEQDPMSDNGKGMMALEKVLHAMKQPLQTHFWPEGRHEILNDHCRAEVEQAIIDWLAECTE
ncbi:MAG: hydrolase [Alcanivorax borkumensis]|jgi:alpha-beta hydrolase superfamily lysophospholipase|uniref:Hydrolase, alpha/beta fold family, putative n=1 Tax=Alcanivorax borkumensis (strain ATCC 700651 / DSM 11573 / NCIMB 13689 / SK2) TaxID=393595 RepID=Q0VPC7_ALCBS|nr:MULTISPECIES: alpha/beta hydrolase [Alcanivorax]OJH06656.1 MAG: hydrolase [Alcanivorax borkumensis]CAL16971.1 hydrolase, alpha/beta fold family, putative [Alcanivorax borkumensis SK2]